MLSLLASLLFISAPDTLRPTTVFVVRHAEKSAEPANDPALSPAGIARAAALDSALAGTKLTAIIVTPYRRNVETAAPLARRFGLTPIVIPIPAQGGVPLHAIAVAAEARRLGGTVLVIGHSNTVGAVVEALGGPAVGDLPDNEYQSLFTVLLGEGGAQVVRGRFGAVNPVAAARPGG